MTRTTLPIADLFLKIRTENKKSDTCFLIGGGPSVKTLLSDPSILKDKDVLTVNNSWSLCPFAILCYFMDELWWIWNKDKIKDFKGYICTLYEHKTVAPDLDGYFQRGYDRGGIADEIWRLNGNNGGHQLINIAVNLSYKEIVLIGYDMNVNDKDSHWHEEHLVNRTMPNRYTNSMIPIMGEIVPDMNRRKFKVWNANPKSAIKCFEYKDLKEFL